MAATKYMMMATEVMQRGASNGEVAVMGCRGGGVTRRSKWRRPRQWRRWMGRVGEETPGDGVEGDLRCW